MVRWDQPPLPDGGEPEYPAPMLELPAPPASQPGSDDHRDDVTRRRAGLAADNTARWLAGGALILAAVARGRGIVAGGAHDPRRCGWCSLPP